MLRYLVLFTAGVLLSPENDKRNTLWSASSAAMALLMKINFMVIGHKPA
jgi:hypothetical protein